MALLSVEEALQRILSGVEPTPAESVPITATAGRTLASPLAARLTQPPFDASAMDGYAVRAADIGRLPATLTVTGQAAAGHPFTGSVGPGQAVRIFTGAAVPSGADAIVIQEDVVRDEASISVREGTSEGSHIRTKGFDFRAGDALLEAGRRIGPREVSLAAAMGYGELPVRRRPRIAVLATGDELVQPGGSLGPGQIIASNHLGVAALAEASGAEARLLGIARDTRESLDAHIAKAGDADVLITIGGASVGDHDLVAPVLEGGMALAFWKIAMRPGKPLMFGRLGQPALGLPGNPVSATSARASSWCSLDPRPARPARPGPAACGRARTAVALEANGPRSHYMRATSRPVATACPRSPRCACRTVPAGTPWRWPIARWFAPSERRRRQPAARIDPATRFLNSTPRWLRRRRRGIALAEQEANN
jgi:molybdopterin molybdotransferase